MEYAKQQRGFTIVELLIVIVVIGILAAIVIVAYNGIQTQASNSAKASELRSIEKLYKLYKAKHGVYPLQNYPIITPVQPRDNNYCLTTGFPGGYCEVVTNPASSYALPENSSETQAIVAALGELGKVPSPPVQHTVGSVMGPWAQYTSGHIDLITTFKIGSWSEGCPSGLARSWPTDETTFNSQNTGRQDCSIRLPK